MTRSLLLVVALGAAAAAVLPARAQAGTKPTLAGIVVAREQARGTLVVAAPHGAVRTLRTHAHVRVGARVAAKATRLADGTYRTGSTRVRGAAHRARVHAVVVTIAHGRLVLSAGGSVFAVRRGRGLAGRGSSVHAGDVVDATVSFAKGGAVTETSLTQVGQAALVELEGTISSLSADTLVLAVERGAVTTIGIPASISLPATIAAGDRVEVLAQFADGAFTLVSIQDDHAAASSGSGAESSDEEHGKVEAEGLVASVSADTISVQPEHGSAMAFTVPSGFDLSGVQAGDRVHAKGVAQSDGSLLLVRLKLQHAEGENDATSSGVEAEGTVSALDATSLTVHGEHGDTTFVVPSGFDLSGLAVGDAVEAKGTASGDGTVTLVSVERKDAANDDSSDSGSEGESGSNGDSGSDG